MDANPDMRFVVDHIAKPLIAAREMEPWAARLAELAKRPNVYCKLSGMVTEADWTGWKPEDLKPYVDRVLELFGKDRVMFGSDWPVCLLAADYGALKGTLESLHGNPEGEIYTKIFGGNAAAPDPEPETILPHIKKAHALILRTGLRITRNLLAEADNLLIISRTGGGLDNVDVAAATAKGIIVTSNLGVNTISVVEHVLSMMLLLAKRLPVPAAG